jgi:hypothetical protein
MNVGLLTEDSFRAYLPSPAPRLQQSSTFLFLLVSAKAQSFELAQRVIFLSFAAWVPLQFGRCHLYLSPHFREHPYFGRKYRACVGVSSFTGDAQLPSSNPTSSPWSFSTGPPLFPGLDTTETNIRTPLMAFPPDRFADKYPLPATLPV